MNTLNQVVKDLKKLSKSCKKDSISQKYYDTLVKYLLLENKYKNKWKNLTKEFYITLYICYLLKVVLNFYIMFTIL